jgi:hypothetical protein
MTKGLLFLALLLPLNLFAQSVTNGRNYAASANGRVYSGVVQDTPVFGSTTTNPAWTTAAVCLSAGNNNSILVFLISERDTGSVNVQSISGCGGAWLKNGSTLAGNGNMTHAELWYSIPAQTGTQTITVTLTGTPSSGSVGTVHPLHNVNPQAPLGTFAAVISGSLSLTLAQGDTAVSDDYDDNNNRGLTAGDCTTTTDLSAFGAIGNSAAHCPNIGFVTAADVPTAKFTWNAFGTNSIAIGVPVKHP